MFHAFGQREPLHPRAQNFVIKKSRVLAAAYTKDFVILVCTVLIRLQRVTDTQTDGQTGRTDAYRP